MPPQPSVLTERQKHDLRELSWTVERNTPLPAEPILCRAYSEPGLALLFRGESLRLFGSLVARLSRPALSEGGPLPEVVESLVTQYVVRSTGGGEEVALEWLEAQLSAPIATWTFVEPVNAYPRHTPFMIGSCTVANDVLELGLDPKEWAPAKMEGPVITTTVEARGQATARLVSVERIAEATALLALLSSPAAPEDGRHLCRQAGGLFGWSTGKRGGLAVGRVDSTGKFWPGYHELSEALARPEDQRSDLEQRVAGAARWWRRASTTLWPSEVLVDGMSALECLLLLASDDWREKGNLVASRAGEIAVVMPKSEQVGWLRKLYKRRNEALHAGRFHQDDLDARNLLELVDLVLHRTVRHLDPWHRGTNAGPCMTAEEALADHEQD